MACKDCIDEAKKLRKRKNQPYEVQELYSKELQDAFTYGVDFVVQKLEKSAELEGEAEMRK